MSDVFISYSRKDLAFVARLRALLEAAGLSVWVDIEGLYAGEEFWPEVAKAVDAALAGAERDQPLFMPFDDRLEIVHDDQ